MDVKVEKGQKSQELIKQFVGIISGLRTDKDQTIEFLKEVIEKLPGVVLVEEESMVKDCFIQGVVDLFTPYESKIFSPARKAENRLAFRFLNNNEAIVNQGWFSGKEVYRGSWILIFRLILSRIQKSSLADKKTGEKMQLIFKILTE